MRRSEADARVSKRNRRELYRDEEEPDEDDEVRVSKRKLCGVERINLGRIQNLIEFISDAKKEMQYIHSYFTSVMKSKVSTEFQIDETSQIKLLDINLKSSNLRHIYDIAGFDPENADKYFYLDDDLLHTYNDFFVNERKIPYYYLDIQVEFDTKRSRGVTDIRVFPDFENVRDETGMLVISKKKKRNDFTQILLGNVTAPTLLEQFYGGYRAIYNSEFVVGVDDFPPELILHGAIKMLASKRIPSAAGQPQQATTQSVEHAAALFAQRWAAVHSPGSESHEGPHASSSAGAGAGAGAVAGASSLLSLSSSSRKSARILPPKLYFSYMNSPSDPPGKAKYESGAEQLGNLALTSSFREQLSTLVYGKVKPFGIKLGALCKLAGVRQLPVFYTRISIRGDELTFFSAEHAIAFCKFFAHNDVYGYRFAFESGSSVATLTDYNMVLAEHTKGSVSPHPDWNRMEYSDPFRTLVYKELFRRNPSLQKTLFNTAPAQLWSSSSPEIEPMRLQFLEKVRDKLRAEEAAVSRP